MKFEEIRSLLKKANSELAKSYPGESEKRQPVHTVYGGAHLFRSDTVKKMGDVALRSLKEYAPDAAAFSRALELPGTTEFSRRIYSRVIGKLKSEPVEDYRLDFEDGYGNRSDSEEDGHAASAATEVARGYANNTLPPFIGIRIKPFSEELFARSQRTMDIFLSTLLKKNKGRLPANFVVTLPKVMIPEQVTALHHLLALLEKKNRLKEGSLKIEIMVETPQSILNSEGRVNLPLLVRAAQGRCTGAHFGTYDYTALCNITAAHQHMVHPACDFARSMMQVSLAQTGVMLSDGATNVMPVGPHKAEEGERLSKEKRQENAAVVYRAWRLNFAHVRHSLQNAFYQGWDLHPAQLPIRYAAIYSFFLEGFDPAATRLKTFVEKAAQATLLGDVFDDAATGQGLLNFFLRALNCGAITEAEASVTGLTREEFVGRSFLKILDSRREKKR